MVDSSIIDSLEFVDQEYIFVSGDSGHQEEPLLQQVPLNSAACRWNMTILLFHLQTWLPRVPFANIWNHNKQAAVCWNW
jgi:hypothetical protein